MWQAPERQQTQQCKQTLTANRQHVGAVDAGGYPSFHGFPGLQKQAAVLLQHGWLAAHVNLAGEPLVFAALLINHHGLHGVARAALGLHTATQQNTCAAAYKQQRAATYANGAQRCT